MQFFAPRNTYAQGERPYDIFKNRMAAISSIVGQVKTNIANKYWSQLNEVTISELGKKIDKDQETEKLNIYNSEPPENIYPQNTEEVAGQFVDYTAGKMLGKEIMKGNLPAPAGTPKGMFPTEEEVMIPKMGKQQLLEYVMSGGEMDFTKILKVIKSRPAFLGEYSALETAAINSVMGRDVMGELEKGVGRANLITEYYKDPEKKIATNMVELAQTDPKKFLEIKLLEESLDMTTAQKNMEMYIGMYNRKEISNDSFLQIIGGYVAPAKLSAFSEKLKLLIDTGMWNRMTDDNKLKFFDAYVASETPGDGLKDLTGTDVNTYNKMFYGDEENWGAYTPEAFATAKEQWESMNKNYPAPEYLDVLEKELQDCLTTDNKIISRTEDNKQTKEWFNHYTEVYQYYKDELKGQSPKYLPPEEIKKVGGIEGAFTGGDVRSGDYGSALPGEGKEKDDKGYIVGETYKDEEGVLWKYLGDGKFEEVEKEESSQKRTR